MRRDRRVDGVVANLTTDEFDFPSRFAKTDSGDLNSHLKSEMHGAGVAAWAWAWARSSTASESG